MVLLTLLLASSVSAKTLKVGVVDSGLDLTDPRLSGHLCSKGHKDFTGEGIADIHGHGTAMAGLIEQYAKGNYCLIIYKYYSDRVSGLINLRHENEALEQAARDGVKIVNLSGGGPEFSEKEYLTIRDNPSILFVVAAGNDGKDLDIPGNQFYPASYNLKNECIVGNVDDGGNRFPSSNYGKKVMATEVGTGVQVFGIQGNTFATGTSAATAIHTGKLIRKLLNAIQSVRN